MAFTCHFLLETAVQSVSMKALKLLTRYVSVYCLFLTLNLMMGHRGFVEASTANLSIG